MFSATKLVTPRLYYTSLHEDVPRLSEVNKAELKAKIMDFTCRHCPGITFYHLICDEKNERCQQEFCGASETIVRQHGDRQPREAAVTNLMADPGRSSLVTTDIWAIRAGVRQERSRADSSDIRH